MKVVIGIFSLLSFLLVFAVCWFLFQGELVRGLGSFLAFVFISSLAGALIKKDSKK
jgi:hypothetical protein